MNEMTRRTLLTKTALAGSAASLAVAGISQAKAESSEGNVFHVFVFEWKPQATDADKARAKTDIALFQGKIPGLLETHVGANLSPRGKSYTFGGVMRFKDQASLDAYVVHPMHQALLKWLVPLIDPIELDLQS